MMINYFSTPPASTRFTSRSLSTYTPPTGGGPFGSEAEPELMQPSPHFLDRGLEALRQQKAKGALQLATCGWSVVYYSNRCSLLLTAFKCIFAHYNAFECIFSAFCVCCILGFVAFSCILDPLCLHSLLLHSSISRCVHFDAFSDLLHFGYDAF